ncbi:heat shock factor protein 1 [Platysternon megacephalum]|uniref:Heat shock factor protein 1 n=1 Tax=Platysternon megacephalum TaxID=55544 RepID=A0A4D9DZY4_9SAUR|nr:heat shock factor protein 1 [Platysternon megacephalum]
MEGSSKGEQRGGEWNLASVTDSSEQESCEVRLEEKSDSLEFCKVQRKSGLEEQGRQNNWRCNIIKAADVFIEEKITEERLVVPNKGYSSLDQSPDEKPLVALDTDSDDDFDMSRYSSSGYSSAEVSYNLFCLPCHRY